MPLIRYAVKNFINGLVTGIEQHSIADDAASNNNNWRTNGDKIFLRRGQRLLGTQDVTGASPKVTGLSKGQKIDATEVLFKSHIRALKYFDTVTADWIEIGTNTLPVAASGEDIAFAPYTSLAGAMMYVSSPNSALYKIMTANPGDIIDLESTAYKGKILIKQNRTFLWDRKGTASQVDKFSPYLSYIDGIDNFTTVTDEDIGTGDGSVKTFTGTLDFKAGDAHRSCFGITAKDTSNTENFTDDGNGVLTGNLGGSGTINYTTGAYSITFITAPAAETILATYQWEDATDQGLADFSQSGTRLAGEGASFLQNDGGDLKTILPIEDTEFCMHRNKTWKLFLTNDDTDADNTIFREKVGLKNWRGAVPTGDGIYYVDDAIENKPEIKLMRFAEANTKVEPQTISGKRLDLSGFIFDQCAGFEFGDMILFACRTTDSSFNNKVIVYNKLLNNFDILDYFVSVFEEYNGALYGGDSISNNVYELFSGLDDDESEVLNNWDSGWLSLGTDAVKKCGWIDVKGEIGTNQSIEVWAAADDGAFVLVDTILSTGSYVDKSQSIAIGASVLGKKEVGGGSVPDQSITAYNFETRFNLGLDRFKRVKVRFKAIGVGWAAISEFVFHDIRIKANAMSRKYLTVAQVLGSAISEGSEIMLGGLGEAWIRIGNDQDGAWRFIIDGDNLLMQKKESGEWNDKQTYEP